MFPYMAVLFLTELAATSEEDTLTALTVNFKQNFNFPLFLPGGNVHENFRSMGPPCRTYQKNKTVART